MALACVGKVMCRFRLKESQEFMASEPTASKSDSVMSLCVKIG